MIPWRQDEIEGDVARIMFDMSVRYEGDYGFPDIEFIDSVETDTIKKMDLDTMGSYLHS